MKITMNNNLKPIDACVHIEAGRVCVDDVFQFLVVTDFGRTQRYFWELDDARAYIKEVMDAGLETRTREAAARHEKSLEGVDLEFLDKPYQPDRPLH